MAIGNNGNVGALAGAGKRAAYATDPTKSAFFWLSAFFVVYCARPEDWIPGLTIIPLAKITAILAMWGLFNSLGRTKRNYKDRPKEARLLLAMIMLMYVGAFLSPIWRGGAIVNTMDFSKIYIAWMLVFLLITTFDRLRRIIFIQAISVVLICVVCLIKGHSTPRLEGVIGGIYGNPNDLAFAIVLSLPFALAFMLTAKSPIKKAFWFVGMLFMLVAIFETASRAGFINLVISGSVTLYHFAIKGKRMYLLVATAFLTVIIGIGAGGKLYDRFHALTSNTSGAGHKTDEAEGSYEDRMFLMKRAVDGIINYPIFGVGARNFPTYSLIWHDVHMTYLQIAVEGGIPVGILFLMFFRRAFVNLKILKKEKNLDEDIVLFVGALYSSLVGFVIGALFAPEAYQLFPYYSVAFTAALLQTIREREQTPGSVAPPPVKPRHFLEVYANRGTTGAVSPVR
ncbi:MAG: O-antigen ligase family protein [Terriglobales bacterium]